MAGRSGRAGRAAANDEKEVVDTVGKVGKEGRVWYHALAADDTDVGPMDDVGAGIMFNDHSARKHGSYLCDGTLKARD